MFITNNKHIQLTFNYLPRIPVRSKTRLSNSRTSNSFEFQLGNPSTNMDTPSQLAARDAEIADLKEQVQTQSTLNDGYRNQIKEVDDVIRKREALLRYLRKGVTDMSE